MLERCLDSFEFTYCTILSERSFFGLFAAKSRQVHISVIIPTRNNPALARRAVASVLDSGHEDLQVVVLENSDRPELAKADFGDDPRVEIHPSQSTLSMPANWERGLDAARGEYVTYLSHKDIVLPGVLAALTDILSASRRIDILSYRKALFLEPTKTVVCCSTHNDLFEGSCSAFLSDWVRVPRHLHAMPGLYNSFVSRDLLEEARGRCDRFFVGNSPDVASAAVLCGYCDTFMLWNHHIAVGHFGDWSNGLLAPRLGLFHANAQQFVKDLGGDLLEELGLPGVLGSAIAEVLLKAQRTHPKALGKYQINWDDFLLYLRKQVSQLEVPPAVRRREWRKVRNRKSIAPRDAVWRHEPRWIKVQLVTAYYRYLSRFVAPLKDIVTGRDRSSRIPFTSGAFSPLWEDAHFNRSVVAHTIDEAIKVVDDINRQGTGNSTLTS